MKLIIVLLAILVVLFSVCAQEGEIALSDTVYMIDELRNKHGNIDEHLNSNADESGDVQVFVTFRSKLTPRDWQLVPHGEYVPKHTVILLTNVTYAKQVLAKHPRIAHVSVLPNSHKYSKCLFDMDLDSQEILADMAGLTKYSLSQSISEESKRTEALDLLVFPSDDSQRLVTKWMNQAKEKFGKALSGLTMKQVSPKKVVSEFKFKTVEDRIARRSELIDWIAQKHHVRHVQLSESFHSESDEISTEQFLKEYASYPLSAHYQDLLEKNYKSLGVFSLNDVQLFWKWNITGKGKVVGVGDTGLDLGNCMFNDNMSEKIKYSEYPEEGIKLEKMEMTKDEPVVKHRKVVDYWAFADKKDTPMGHGSHVAGVLVGSLQNSDNQNIYTGVLPDAKLAFVDLGLPDKTLRLPADLSESYFPYMVKNGAKVFSNSWGNRHYGVYTLAAREIDHFMWKNPYTLALYAAGNSGREGGSTITAPGTAKNCLTVGSSEATATNFKFGIPLYSDTMRGSVPCSDSSFIFHTPEFCGEDRPVPCNDPKTVKTTCDALQSGDKLAEEVCCKVPFLQKICCSAFLLKKNLYLYNKESKEYQSNNVAVFSSRGPTLDGRIKPEILTIGQPIFSVRAHGKVFDGKKCPVPQVMQGTSQSTPIAAGLAVMLRTYMETLYAKFNNVIKSQAFQTKQIEDYSSDKTYGSMIKALLINSGSELNGVVDINGQGTIKKLTGFPSFTQGFGVINLTSVLPFPGNDKFLFAHQDAIETNKVSEYCFRVPKNARVQKATLVWTDFPANPNAKYTLVNNLDLIVQAGRNEFWGNNARPNEGDEINVIEQVILPNRADTVKVSVKGTNVPHGPQPFSLVISGTGSVEIVDC